MCAEKVAIVAVGIDSYANLPPLSCAVNDARAIFATWRSLRKDTATYLLANEEATTKNIRETLVAAAKEVGEDGTLIVTFSGHGVPVKVEDIWEAGFLTCEAPTIDQLVASGADECGVFTLQDVKRWLKAAKVARLKNIVMILDSCGSGTSITRDPTIDDGATFEGWRALPRNLGVDRDFVADELADENVEVTLGAELAGTNWPTGNVLAISAAKAGSPAFEVPELGHGVLTWCFLEWLRCRFLINPQGTDGMERELMPYIQQNLKRLRHSADRELPQALQTPQSIKLGEIQIQNPSVNMHHPMVHNSLKLGLSMPVPQRTIPEDLFNANVDKIVDTVRWMITTAHPASERLGNSNLMIKPTRFLSVRSTLRSAARKLSANHPDRLVLPLGAGRIRRILPLIGSMESVFDYTAAANCARRGGPPFLANAERRIVDSFVERLRQHGAILIIPCHVSAKDPLTEYFLEQCVRTDQICVVMALLADEPVPEFLSCAHYVPLQLNHRPEDYATRLADLGFDPEDNWNTPEIFCNTVVVHWLETVRKLYEERGEDWNLKIKLAAHPYRERKNHLRAVLNVLEHLLPALAKTDAWRDALQLLTVMSITGLPRSELVVKEMWETLKDRDCLSHPERPLTDVLDDLHNEFLIRKSDQGGDEELPVAVERHYFVHSIVRNAVQEYEARQDAARQLPAHKYAGAAIEAAIAQCESTTWWPRPVLAHEIIEHYLNAGHAADAARVLLENWHDLVDGGYHETVLRWANELRPRIITAPMRPPAASLELLVPLLIKLQDLHKHRQEWERIVELHREIDHWTTGHRAAWTAVPTNGKANCFSLWFAKSRYNVANYYFIKKSFARAIGEYNRCYVWACQNNDSSLECACLIRIAHCKLLSGETADTKDRLDFIKERIAELSTSDAKTARKHARHLRSVRIEAARLFEDIDQLSQLSMEAWSDCLAQVANNGVQRRYDLAIANVHTAWAALMRGEFLLAWRQARQSRRLLNDRGIPEHWWFGEAERIAALAVAHLLHGDHAPYEPWYKTGVEHSDAIRQLLQEEVPRQQEALEDLIRASQVQNPWRAAELMSALGQLLAFTGKKEKGVQYLNEAKRLAKRRRHFVLLTYIEEALALLEPPAKTATHFVEACKATEQAGLKPYTKRRERNRRKSESLV